MNSSEISSRFEQNALKAREALLPSLLLFRMEIRTWKCMVLLYKSLPNETILTQNKKIFTEYYDEIVLHACLHKCETRSRCGWA